MSAEPLETVVAVDPSQTLGEVTPLVYGHFTEHLVHIMYGGLWSEHLYGRKFEAPMAHRRRHTMATPWEPFAGRNETTQYLRGQLPLGRYASPHGGAHHSQSVIVEAGNDGAERGVIQPEVTIDDGTTYVVRVRARRIGPIGALRVALRANDGETILGEATLEFPVITETRFGPAAYPTIFMDDLSFTELETTITATGSDLDGWLSLTFVPSPDEVSAFWFDSASMMPADHIEGWHRQVIDDLRELPVQLLKWPGGCMADDYDWRLGIGPRDARFGSVDQAWAAWDENDVGTDDFMTLCRLTGAEPVFGVNAGTGTPELAAAWVEYCNGTADTEWGAVRAANGHPEPYGVKYWAVGNEQWGFFERGYVGPELYAQRYIAIAEAMRKVDSTIVLAAVGQAGEFNRIVLKAAAPLIDLLQIHHYTSEAEPAITDAGSASRKIATASEFDGLFTQLRSDIDSVAGAEHVRICLDEWGWGRSGHTGAVFLAACLNAMHRVAPLVHLGARACAINVDGVVDREGETVVRTPNFEVFRLYGLAHLPTSVAISVDGANVDASCLAGDTGERSVFLVNRGAEATSARVDLAGTDAGTPVTVHTVAPGDNLAGASVVDERADRWHEHWDLPALSLTVLRVGVPE